MTSRVFSSTRKIWFRTTPNPDRLPSVAWYFSKTKRVPESAGQREVMLSKVIGCQKGQKSRKRLERPSSFVTLKVAGTGAFGAPKCLFVSTDASQYIFNCGEGTQRLVYEYHYKLNRLDNIFITTPVWGNIGGLPGMFLGLQETGLSDFALHGPDGMNEIYDMIKKFIHLQNFTIKTVPCMVIKEFNDATMNVRYVLLNKSATAEATSDDRVGDAAYELKGDGKRAPLDDGPGKKVKKLKSPSVESPLLGSMAYICRLHPRPGALSLEMCVEKGVKPGPVLGTLKAGHDVTLPDGTVIASKDVCSPPEPGAVFIVVDCPTEDYLDSVVNNPLFEKHQATASDAEDLAFCVVHFTPQEIMENERYKEWMGKFDPSTQHLVLNDKNECLGSKGAHRMNHKLHLLHPRIFPLMNESTCRNGDECKNAESASRSDSGAEDQPKVHYPRTQEEIHLRPRKGLNTDSAVTIYPKSYVKEIFECGDLTEDDLVKLQERIDAKTKALGEIAEYPKVLMLGTGSCKPNKERNTSGILVRFDEDSSVIMDCAEGTMGQIVRFYGKSEAARVLASIKAIYVSHLHADHHMGLIGLLKAREKFNEEPLYLLAPSQLLPYLNTYHAKYQSVLECFIFVPNEALLFNKCTLSTTTGATKCGLYKALDMSYIGTTRVKHASNSFGVAWTRSNGQKLVYSGDTMPCEDLVELGRDADLLIHEATIESGMESDAREKRHSTISQAINIGEIMRAKFTLLTHFSQKFSKIVQLPEDMGVNEGKVGIAYDNMQVSLSELPLLPLLYPTLTVLFSEEFERLKAVKTKRQARKMRESN